MKLIDRFPFNPTLDETRVGDACTSTLPLEQCLSGEMGLGSEACGLCTLDLCLTKTKFVDQDLWSTSFNLKGWWVPELRPRRGLTSR